MASVLKKIGLSLILLSGLSFQVHAQETVFTVQVNTWDPSGTWAVSGRTEYRMINEVWSISNDGTFFIVPWNSALIPDSYGTWLVEGTNFMMFFDQYEGKSFGDNPMKLHFRIDRMSQNNVSLVSLGLEISRDEPAYISMVRRSW